MYEPNVTVTAKLMEHLKEIEECRDILHTIPVLGIVEQRIRHRALVETVHYTTRIEGNPLSIKAVERLGRRRSAEPEIDRPHEQEVLNLYRVMQFIRDVASQPDVPINEDVVRQIHAFVVRDIPGQGSPGLYKTKPNEIVDQSTRKRIFMPASSADTPRLMGDFGAWLSQTPQVFHPVITAGIAHLELVAIHPFDDGNGRTARALADLILDRREYSLRHFFSWVRQVGIDMNTYHEKLTHVLGPEYGANVDPTTWLEYFAEVLASSMSGLKPHLLEIRRKFVDAYNIGAQKGFTRDQVEALAFASVYGDVTSGDYMRATGLSRSTVIKRLNDLSEAGLLGAKGKGRNARYVLSAHEALRSPPQPMEGAQLKFEEAEGVLPE